MSDKGNQTPGPAFDDAFGQEFVKLLQWRRDVRHFKRDPLPSELVEELLALTDLSPSVGNSQPWRFVMIEEPSLRSAIYEDFKCANSEALNGYKGDKAALYANLKLSGLDDAPVHIAVYCDEAPAQGRGLGRQTMPETLRYSVVSAIHTLWLAARTRGVGLGWVSILHPDKLQSLIQVPDNWSFVAYLCLGYPTVESDTPELQQVGWQERTPWQTRVYKNKVS
ncbi:5,6-dimethylbenzimidazole synthase [Rhodobacteraceae bacterium RKSG542]|uniref:5,6-dimethylbenzimidazole synthase n=1 Tax=Pseudovibrio flavus TaxID=2529854 RepID=UPI0012BBB0A6|nr:5,6-dimethylbenzimidazole synthase [Pseudovibrio flavus]MTI19014.1 5,6-dimethylbenzimidazole synthase [Pseudovibrio flavus]